jgi:hypothetical protein
MPISPHDEYKTIADFVVSRVGAIQRFLFLILFRSTSDDVAAYALYLIIALVFRLVVVWGITMSIFSASKFSLNLAILYTAVEVLTLVLKVSRLRSL